MNEKYMHIDADAVRELDRLIARTCPACGSYVSPALNHEDEEDPRCAICIEYDTRPAPEFFARFTIAINSAMDAARFSPSRIRRQVFVNLRELLLLAVDEVADMIDAIDAKDQQ